MSEPGTVSTSEEKRTSWSELFFDLVFVFAVTEVSALLEHDPTWAGVLRAFVVFVPIYWVWVGVTVQGDVRDLSAPLLRITVFAIALGGLFMALAVPDAYGESAMLLALSYWGSRVLLGIVVLGPNRRHLNPVTVSMVMTGPLLVCGALVHGDLRLAFWSLAAVADLATPTLLRLRLSGMHFDAAHLAERFGLFVLIAIGESVVAIGGTANAQGPITLGVGGAVAVAFVVTCALWWVYFHFAADAVRHALATAPVQMTVTRLVLSYGHLSFIAGIIAASVGLREAVAKPGHELSSGSLALLFGGSALYLATFGYTRWMMFRLVSKTRLSAAVIVLIAMFPARYVPAFAALVILATPLIALNVVELAHNDRIGWRSLLDRQQRSPR
jgi:low temperature requirement protein LtrA